MSITSGNKGLGNLGNTCYMNSALQCLSHLLEFHPKNQSYLGENRNNSDIYNEWLQLQIELWSNDDTQVIIPKRFLQMFMSECRRKDIFFYNFQQNDTEEFINIFMQMLHTSIKKDFELKIQGNPKSQLDKLAIKSFQSWSNFFKNDYSYIIKKFYSQLLSITSCTECNYVSTTFDPCMILSLEIPKEAETIYECIDSYTKRDTLDTENCWKCDKCKKLVSPERQLMLWKTSDVLIIQLKRYTKRSKNDNFIEFPINLDLSSYSINYNKQGSNYRLSGISIQSGSLGGGHYYAMCRNELDGLWREYNDTNVRIVSDSELLKQKPYCLFYRRL